MIPAPPSFESFLHGQYDKVFARRWPVASSALLIAALNVFLFAFDKPWTASEGMRNWGDSLFHLLGIIRRPDLLPPWLYSGSVLNLGVLVGALAAALLSGEFAVRPAPPREMVKGAMGGLLMGWGAMLAFGCNIGGFFSALSALSLSGVGMMAGMIIGSFAATRYLVWERVRQFEKGQLSFVSPCETPVAPAGDSASFGAQPVIGASLILVSIAAALLYGRLGHTRLGIFLFFGLAFGVVCQRSRFCLVNAFREPFMSGQSEHARAAALALTLSMIGFSILKATDLKDAGEWVFPSFWLGSLIGGAIFGAGMVIAEGCGAGSLWRAGEGHVKLWIAVLFFAVGAAMMRHFLVATELIRQLGSPLFLPDLIGWSASVWAVVISMALWYLISGWIDARKSAGQLKF